MQNDGQVMKVASDKQKYHKVKISAKNIILAR